MSGPEIWSGHCRIHGAWDAPAVDRGSVGCPRCPPTRRYAPRAEGDVLILVPRAANRGTREQRVWAACRWLWSRGIYPSPAAVSLRLHGRATRSINGFETRIRNRFLAEEGIPRQRSVPGWIRRIDERLRQEAGR